MRLSLSQYIKEALRRDLGFELLETIWARNQDLTEDEAVALADEAKHATRARR